MLTWVLIYRKIACTPWRWAAQDEVPLLAGLEEEAETRVKSPLEAAEGSFLAIVDHRSSLRSGSTNPPTR